MHLGAGSLSSRMHFNVLVSSILLVVCLLKRKCMIFSCGNAMNVLTTFTEHLGRCFHMKDLEKPKYFLGIHVRCREEDCMLTQRKYTLDIISDVGLLGSKQVVTPMELHDKLALDLSPFLHDIVKYRRLVVRLIYLSIMQRINLIWCISNHNLCKYHEM